MIPQQVQAPKFNTLAEGIEYQLDGQMLLYGLPEASDLEETEGFLLLQGNSLVGGFYWTPEKYLEDRCQKFEVDCKITKAIIQCESNWRDWICSYAGCNAGIGLFGIIPSTNKHCEEKLGRELDPYNWRDNIDCGIYLLKFEGLYHWKSSEKCWQK